MNIKKFLKQHPALNYAEDIRMICKPLELLDIVYFSHVNIDDNQQLSALATTPDFFEHYFNKGYFNYDLHKAHTHLGEEYILWDYVKCRENSQALHQDFLQHNSGHTFSLVSNNGSSKDCFHFATRRGNESMNEKYLQLIGQFKQFISYFREKVANHKQLANAYNMKIQLNPKIGGYLTEDLHLDLTNFNEQVQSTRAYIGGFDKYFTKRELECLHWFAEGYTVEKTAIKMNITARTVKAHIKAMKGKLDCNSQFQLGMYFARLIYK